VDTRWLAFPLHPETPPEGRSLTDLFAGQPVDVTAMMRRLQQVAAELGLPFGNRSMTYNSRLAQELGKWALSQNRQDLYDRAVFQAYFGQGQNIAQLDVLLDIVNTIGLSPDSARQALETRAFKQAVDEDWQRSMQIGVKAVPTLVSNGNFLVGAQPYEVMEKFLIDQQVPPRNDTP
jgi:predicted DsbA family dithiol-disulfide isomerase